MALRPSTLQEIKKVGGITLLEGIVRHNRNPVPDHVLACVPVRVDVWQELVKRARTASDLAKIQMGDAVSGGITAETFISAILNIYMDDHQQ